MPTNKINKDVMDILKLYKEPDIPDKIINKIKSLYPEIKYSDFIHTEEIIEGDVIYTVSLDFKKLSIPGKCIKIEYTHNTNNKNIKNILLVNNKADIFWRIKPTKYYIFRIISNKNAIFRKLLEDLHLKNNFLKNK